MSEFDYDYFVIGAGSGGVRSARIAAGHGAKVGIAEDRYFGGTCVNVGCVPKKLMVIAADFARSFADARGFGWSMPDTASHDWSSLIAAKDKEIERLNGIYDGLLGNAGVTVHWGRARVTGPNSVEVAGETVTARHILIATGGEPVIPTEPGAEHGITSDDVFYLEELPKRVIVAGGGYIACEFAGIFNGLGAEVIHLYRGETLLRGFDTELGTHLGEIERSRGIDYRNNTIINRTDKLDNGRLRAELSDGETVEVDQILYAIGRRPKVDGLGLRSLGVEMNDRGAIKVNDRYETSIPSILAVGDVTDRVQLTPVAIAEGHVLADRLFTGADPDDRAVDYDDIPTAIFSTQPIGTVGLSEDQATQRGIAYTLYRASFTPMQYTLAGRTEKTLMKLLVCPETDRVLGCHMLGPDAPEIAQGLGIAIKAGATKAHFDRTIGIHPTAAEEFVTMRTPVGG
ncbi:MAG: glutathione-disulfide reductase [Alphaproteobacteria bacterium]